jgi:hypothetical protein
MSLIPLQQLNKQDRRQPPASPQSGRNASRADNRSALWTFEQFKR